MKILEEYKISFGFIKNKLGRTVLLVTVIFFATCIIAGIVFYNDSASAKTILASYMDSLGSVSDESGNISFLGLLKNNLFACVKSIGLGLIPFIFLPVISILANGLIIGTLLGYGEAMGTLNVFKAVVFGMLPHGIFELPAVLISISLGIYVCKTISLKIITHDGSVKFLEAVNSVARVFALIIIPLIVIAALIECFITPIILTNLGI